MFCKPQGTACHAAVLLAETEALPLSAAPVCLTVSLGAWFRLCVGTTERGPWEDPFQGEIVSSPASLQQHFLGKQ